MDEDKLNVLIYKNFGCKEDIQSAILASANRTFTTSTNIYIMMIDM